MSSEDHFANTVERAAVVLISDGLCYDGRNLRGGSLSGRPDSGNTGRRPRAMMFKEQFAIAQIGG